MSRLVYRSIGAAGAYPEWLRGLDDKSGAYVLRSRGGSVLYVGESHTRRLRSTIVRHFQQWKRKKSWWSGWFGQQHDPGTVYDRGDIEIAVCITPSNRAVVRQDELIRKLKPRDNLIGQAEEKVPF